VSFVIDLIAATIVLGTAVIGAFVVAFTVITGAGWWLIGIWLAALVASVYRLHGSGLIG
jgi:hypothetical protein